MARLKCAISRIPETDLLRSCTFPCNIPIGANFKRFLALHGRSCAVGARNLVVKPTTVNKLKDKPLIKLPDLDYFSGREPRIRLCLYRGKQILKKKRTFFIAAVER